MLPTSRFIIRHNKLYSNLLRKRFFLTNAYSCNEVWNSRTASPILNKVNLNDFYISLEQVHSSKGVISATDVDIFANAMTDSTFLDELKDLLLKLRLSAETGNTLESTHHATIRNYIDHGTTEELIEILANPLTFGVFLDDFTTNILLNKLLKSENYEQAASVASIFMLQEDFTNDIACTLSQFACLKHVMGYVPPEIIAPEPIKKKVEEFKIRVKYLRNPYFDEHFDLKDGLQLAGKTLAWISQRQDSNINNNLEIIGWLYFKKFDKLKGLCEKLSKKESFRLHTEVKDLLLKESHKEGLEAETKEILTNSMSLLSKCQEQATPLEEALKVAIENAINKTQKQDIEQQVKIFESWSELREEKLNEQIKRLDRAKRIQLIQEQQNKMKDEEQKLWFFENEEKIDLEIEEKEKLLDITNKVKKTTLQNEDDDYIPPEILPQKK